MRHWYVPRWSTPPVLGRLTQICLWGLPATIQRNLYVQHIRVGHPRAETTPPRRDSVLQNQTWTGRHHLTICADPDSRNRCQNTNTLQVVTSSCLTYQYSYFVLCVPVWNHLPQSAIDAQTIAQFQTAAFPTIRALYCYSHLVYKCSICS